MNRTLRIDRDAGPLARLVSRARRGEPPPPAPSSDAWRRTLRRRLLWTACVFGVWTAGIEARLAWLQVVQHDALVARAERQQSHTIPAPAKRGDIVDRNGRLLAYSADADSIYAVPSEVDDPAAAATALCAALEACADRERDVLRVRLSRQRAFAYVRRHVSPDEARRVAALGLEGIGFFKESRRFYPKRELAAHLLGFVGLDNSGLGGVERVYDPQIRGRAGTILVQTDARRRAFSRVERPPTAGASLELTLDEYLQHVAERELRIGVAENRAAGGTAIVMDPRTGEILAMANEPTFNPNAFKKAGDAEKRNRATQDVYEPGSTFKIVTASAAIEERVIGLEDPIDVSAGMIRIGSRQVDDVHRYGTLSFTDVMVKSSNVGAIKVGFKLGAERLGRYVRRFGFGQGLSRDFPGESSGIVWDSARWNDSALASISMGYQIGVTPLQMAAAASAIANGGELIEPRVVRALVNGRSRSEIARRVIRRTIAPATAAELTGIMEAVVERGTATRAQVEGFTIAGKTGTSAKIVNGRYSRSEYMTSFVGFVPSRKPAFTILVVIDSPHSRHAEAYGGTIAAPVFQRIAEAALRHAGVPPTLNAPPPLLVSRRGDSEQPTPTPVRTPSLLQPISQFTPDQGLMPDLRGMGAREALRTLARIGMSARVDGDGFVVEQVPGAGTPIDRGGACTLALRRTAPAGASP